MKNAVIVGSRIRAWRESKKISAEQVTERSGLTLEQLDRIENGMNLPSLAPLIRIARALGVRLGTFLDDSESLGPVICRKADYPATISFSSETAGSHGGGENICPREVEE